MAGGQTGEVSAEQVRVTADDVDGSARQMRGQHQPRTAEQRAVHRQRLRRAHVKDSASDRPRPQSPDQRGLVHARSSRVDQVCGRPHRRQRLRVDQVDGLRAAQECRLTTSEAASSSSNGTDPSTYGS